MRKTALAVLGGTAFFALVFATPAAACVFLPVTCIGGGPECNPTEAERRAQRRHWSFEGTRQRARAARERLRAGHVDFAGEISELLVPNVRPIFIETSDCGPENEIDYGEGREDWFQKMVAGTLLDGTDLDSFMPVINRADVEFSFGVHCNAEFRRSFADHFRRSVDPEHLREAWLFLIARQRTHDEYGLIYHRLVAFDRRARTPPTQWILADEWLRDQVRRYIRRQPAGRAVAAAADAFWAERGADLGDDARVCPVFSAQWESGRRQVVAQMIEYQEAQQGRARPNQP